MSKYNPPKTPLENNIQKELVKHGFNTEDIEFKDVWGSTERILRYKYWKSLQELPESSWAWEYLDRKEYDDDDCGTLISYQIVETRNILTVVK
jgi:hypothetical protein